MLTLQHFQVYNIAHRSSFDDLDTYWNEIERYVHKDVVKVVVGNAGVQIFASDGSWCL